jgi:hypothetical protein
MRRHPRLHLVARKTSTARTAPLYLHGDAKAVPAQEAGRRGCPGSRGRLCRSPGHPPSPVAATMSAGERTGVDMTY